MANTVTAKWDGVKVFSATKMQDRDRLGETVTDWFERNRHLEPVETVVTQSSDESFHCVTISVFYARK